jgi:hypothetical protein
MGRSTFYKHVPKHYKKPSKSTDLCNICEAGKRNEMALRKQRQSGSEASDVQRDALQRRVDYYRVHKRLVNVQRKCYTSEVVVTNSSLVYLSHSRDDGFPFLIGRWPGSRTGCLDP